MVLYCTAMYCDVICGVILYCLVLVYYRVVQYGIALCDIEQYFLSLYCNI